LFAEAAAVGLVPDGLAVRADKVDGAEGDAVFAAGADQCLGKEAADEKVEMADIGRRATRGCTGAAGLAEQMAARMVSNATTLTARVGPGRRSRSPRHQSHPVRS
jgi:hypothetical protein